MSSMWDGLRNDTGLTQVPKYAINQGLPEDTFYTDPAVAKSCVKILLRECKKYGINQKQYTFVEPSAGGGSFCNALPARDNRKIIMDLMPPPGSGIKKQDFLKWYPKRDGKYIVVGNPPFGVRGALALAFLKRAFLFADVVAFILPVSFYSNGKGSNMLRALEHANLVYSKELKPDIFYEPQSDQSVGVNTVFQVWMRNRGPRSVFKDYDVSEYVDIKTVCSAPDRYCGLGRGIKYDCYVASTYFGDGTRTVPKFKDVKYGSGFGMVIKKDHSRVLRALNRTKWGRYAQTATNSCKHIRMHSIRLALGDAGFGCRV